MRKLVVGFLELAFFTAVLSGALALGASNADARSALSIGQQAPTAAAVMPVDYYWHRQHWHHRHWNHNRWNYY
ncbi:MAG: hypothetical protein M3Y41_08575, partial [Pseudomonadota bacterium]|nr:hypothetical protein [Pseudomonadota bacterium]